MKNCQQCGAPISSGDSVCRYCGRKFESDVDHSQNSVTTKGKDEERKENRPVSNITQHARIHLSNEYKIKKKSVFRRIVIGFVVIILILCLLSVLL